MLTDLCIYTIKHSNDLDATLAKGGRDTYTEGKKWVRAKQLLEDAKREGKRLPLIFAPAESCVYLIAWAVLDEVIPGEPSRYTFSELRRIVPQQRKTTLRKDKDGEPLGERDIRPYRICKTPDYLVEQPGGRLVIKGLRQPPSAEIEGFSSPDEISSDQELHEGAKKQISVNAYERNPRAREACISHHGSSCTVCGFDFGRQYGKIGTGYIVVHHLKPLSEIGAEYPVDPEKDLRPVCPNCHAMLHKKDPPYKIEKLRKLVVLKFAGRGA